MKEEIPFNKWSQQRIAAGKKICTSRTRAWADKRVYLIRKLPLGMVRDHFWQEEGADSPEEFERVWKSIHRGKFDREKMVFVHFGRFSKTNKGQSKN